MADLEKVIIGLECCSQGAKEPYTPTIRYCAECPYLKSEIPCTRELARDALSLLKEQEAVPVIQREAMNMLVWCCGSCGVVITNGDKFCRMCGKAVKWDE